MALPVIINLVAYQGDSWEQKFRLRDGASPLDLSTATVEAEMRAEKGEAKFAFVVDISDATNGEITLSLPVAPADMPPHGNYFYDIEVTLGSAITSWIRGQFYIRRDVTNE